MWKSGGMRAEKSKTLVLSNLLTQAVTANDLCPSLLEGLPDDVLRSEIYPQLNLVSLSRLSASCRFFYSNPILSQALKSTRKREQIRYQMIIKDFIFLLTNQGHVFYKHKDANRFETPTILQGVRITEVYSLCKDGKACLFLTAQARTFAFGDNFKGCAGLDNLVSVNTITEIVALQGVNVTNIHLDGFSTLFQSANKIYGCGDNQHGNLSMGVDDDEIRTPTEVKLPISLVNIKDFKIIAKQKRTYFLADGKLYGCGNNTLAQLGQGHTHKVSLATAINVPDPVTKVIVDPEFTGIVSEYEFYVCGRSIPGSVTPQQTVLVPTPMINTPTKTHEILGVHISSQYNFMFVKFANDGTHVRGDNRTGQLGLLNRELITRLEKISIDGKEVEDVSTQTWHENQATYLSVKKIGLFVCGEVNLKKLGFKHSLESMPCKTPNSQDTKVVWLSESDNLFPFFIGKNHIYHHSIGRIENVNKVELFDFGPKSILFFYGKHKVVFVNVSYDQYDDKPSFCPVKEIVFLRNKHIINIEEINDELHFFGGEGIYTVSRKKLLGLSYNKQAFTKTLPSIFDAHIDPFIETSTLSHSKDLKGCARHPYKIK